MKPAIVIAHGCWHVPAHYDPLSDALRARGFDVHVPHLPTMTPAAGTKTQTDDEIHLRAAVSALTDAGRDVVVLAHSYGGAVATQAVGPLAAGPGGDGAAGGVVHLIYMTAYMLRRGETAGSVSLPRPTPEFVALGDDGLTTETRSVDPVGYFYADVEPALAERSVAMLVPSSLANRVPVTEPAWERIPVTYVVCSRDRACTPEWQWGMIEGARAQGVEVEVEVLDSGHSPFLSRTGEVVGIVERVAGRYG